MELVDGFVRWASNEDRDSFMAMCEPFLNPPLDAQGFVKWVSEVVQSHAQGSADKQLLAAYLSVFISELAPTYLARVGEAHGVVPNGLVGDLGSGPHVVCGTGKVGNASLLH